MVLLMPELVGKDSSNQAMLAGMNPGRPADNDWFPVDRMTGKASGPGPVPVEQHMAKSHRMIFPMGKDDAGRCSWKDGALAATDGGTGQACAR